jgi:hypothetical protein
MSNILDRWFDVERAEYGKAEYHWKGDTFGSRLRAFYSRPFCPRYAEGFTTTIYPDTFFALKKKGDPVSCLETEFHENVHKWDAHTDMFFSVLYAWPHWAAVFPMLAAVVLGGPLSWVALLVFALLFHGGLVAMALSERKGRVPTWSRVLFYVLSSLGLLSLVAATIIGGGWFALFWLPAFLFLGPWPFKPVYRRDYELRGYTMTLYVQWLKYRYVLDEKWWAGAIDWCVRAFTGPAYMYMERDGDRVRKEFEFQADRFRNDEDGFLSSWRWSRGGEGSIRGAGPFNVAKRFIEEEGLFDGSGNVRAS